MAKEGPSPFLFFGNIPKLSSLRRQNAGLQPPTIDEEVGGCCVVCIVIEKSFCAEPSCYRFILCRSASVS